MILRPYQHEIVKWIIAHDRCAIWSPMGSGKTLATLYALSSLALLEEPAPTLVLAPKRVALTVWPAEVAKWPNLDLTCSVISGTERERLVALKRKANIYTINYDMLDWLVDALGDDWPFQTVIADESTKLKGFRTRQGGKRAKALGSVAHKYVRRFIELTGTPATQGVVDLWGQMWFLDKGERLGATHTAFLSRWFITGYGGWGHRPCDFAHKQIEEKIADLCVTIDCGFAVDKPVVRDILVALPPKARQLYDELERDMFIQLENATEITAVNAAALSGKCHQLANGAVYDENKDATVVHDAKLDALESIIEEANGMPVLVAYNFKSDLARLQKRFSGGRVLDTNPQTIKDWNAGNIPILFLHPASAGHGLNLQDGGNIIAFFSMTWPLEHYLQAVERIGPMRQMQSGHKRPVFVYRILAADTVDELIVQRWESNESIQSALMRAMRKGAVTACMRF